MSLRTRQNTAILSSRKIGALIERKFDCFNGSNRGSSHGPGNFVVENVAGEEKKNADSAK